MIRTRSILTLDGVGVIVIVGKDVLVGISVLVGDGVNEAGAVSVG